MIIYFLYDTNKTSLISYKSYIDKIFMFHGLPLFVSVDKHSNLRISLFERFIVSIWQIIWIYITSSNKYIMLISAHIAGILNFHPFWASFSHLLLMSVLGFLDSSPNHIDDFTSHVIDNMIDISKNWPDKN